MKQRICLTINEFIVKKTDEIAQGLRISRSRAIEDLLSMVFDLGATVEDGKLTYEDLKNTRDLEERVEQLEEMVGALTRKRKKKVSS
jgi:metal-responsive CopG/Arc/MetJ family transcriptional regulator